LNQAKNRNHGENLVAFCKTKNIAKGNTQAKGAKGVYMCMVAYVDRLKSKSSEMACDLLARKQNSS